MNKVKPDQLKGRLLEKLGDIRSKFTIEADKMKLQIRLNTENM
jgi:hypothetical protein